MAAPDKLLIQHEDFDFGRFHHVGRFGRGHQFMAFLTYADPKSYYREETTPDGEVIFRQYTNCFAVLHRFDADGRHTSSDIVRVDGTQVSEAQDWGTLDEMIAALGEVEFCDIRVKLFSTEVQGVKHGLFYKHLVEDGWESEYVMLEPCDIMFHPPWDSGEYST